MKIINQLGIIMGFWITGDLLSRLISSFVQIPSAIMGMVLFAIALTTGVIKEQQVKEISDLLLNNISFFFVPASVGILAISGMTANIMFKVIAIAIVSTIVTMFVTMWVTHALIKRKKKRV
ncbi:CidA/LrgA family protein [Fusibacter bizertensis]|uniref:CidA/LrgA family protein n=1 Tax=Fusibacter bizertensis TaxID=1488331 RepID=A0ABT6NBC3_9FIRM|nr:CidA/LrgA family protein [Fusibacter bizertensis]MDH8677715.1 CidA/LrgA family protein [Fusibacter bizertensis]